MKLTKLLITSTLIAYSATLSAVDVTVSKQQAEPYSNLLITYSDAEVGSKISLYHNASVITLTAYRQITDANFSNGSFSTKNLLEPGKYRIAYEFDGKSTDVCNFSVNEMSVVQGRKNIVLMTDIHVMASSLLISGGSAFDAVIAGDRKMLDKSEEIFTALVDSLLVQKPDLFLITGDLTKDGELVSHQSVVKQLDRLRAAGIPTLVIPGNHDLRNPNAYSFDGDTKMPVESVEYSDFAQLYQNYGYGTDAVRDTASLSYCAEPLPGLCILGIDGTRAYENTTTNRSDYGRLLPQTLQWLLDRADEATKEGKQVVAMQHHQLIQHYNRQAQTMPSAAVENGDEIAQQFIAHGIRLVLTGHMHISNITTIYNESKTDSLVEISTGATVSYPVPYRYLTLNEKLDEIGVQTRYLRALGDIDDMMLFSRQHMEQRSAGIFKSLVRQASPKFDEFIPKIVTLMAQKSYGIYSESFLNRLVGTLPQTANARADFFNEYFGDAFRLALLTTSEGNEQRKAAKDTIEAICHTGIDGVIDYMYDNAGFTADEKVINMLSFRTAENMKAMFSGDLKSMIESQASSEEEKEKMTELFDLIDSVLEDCSYCGTDNENHTNDLYLTIQLPQPREDKDTSNEIIDKNESVSGWWDILGRRLQGEPAESGIYLHNGKKILIVR